MPIPVFDLDDTLYPERDYVLSGFAAVGRWVEEKVGFDAGETEARLVALFESGVRENTFDLWLDEVGVRRPGLSTRMVEAYRTHIPDISLDPAVGHLLEHLGRRGPLGLITDGPAVTQRAKIKALGLDRRIDCVIVTAELGSGFSKPHRLPFELALTDLGVDACDAVYVADNPTKDFLGARGAGMASIRLRRPEGVYAQLEPETLEHRPDCEISSLFDLEMALERMSDQRLIHPA